MYYIFSRTSVGTTNDGSSAYSVGAHGNVGNFVYADGHAGSMQGFGEYRGVVKTMFTSQGLSTTYTACYNSGKVLNY